MADAYYLSKATIAKFLPDPQDQRRYDIMQRTVARNGEIVTANIAATEALKDASYVTLSPNTELPNEYVLGVGSGLSMTVEPGSIVIAASSETVASSGGFSVTLTAEGDSSLAIPLTGYVATRAGVETLQNKTLQTPILSGLGDYADDTAAAAGGVPVGGVYRTASALKIRVT